MIIEQNKVLELAFYPKVPYEDESVVLTAHFTAPDGATRTVSAFWSGGGLKIRYSSAQIGIHTYVTNCSDTGNDRLHAVSGEVFIIPYTGDNELYKHGSVVRREDHLYLSHQDGKPFFWLGDTWWMGLTVRLPWAEGFSALTKDRVDKGFNVVQIVAGLYPDMEPFDERGKNEAGLPWDEGYKSINSAYFDAADKKIAYLVENGITPCIVGCWGFYMKMAGMETILRHWQNLIARWAAYPVVWCIAGEANWIFYDDEMSPEDQVLRGRAFWNEVTEFVHDRDPFDRLVTIHPARNGHDQLNDESLLDLDMLQTGHNGAASIIPTMKQVKFATDRKKLPVINAEVCYEGICSSSYADVQRYMFWACFMLGTCGHTYGANGIWQLNTKEKPYGASPHGAHWGDTPWEDAARLPGSYQVGIAKKFITRFEWWRFEQHPEWISKPCSYTDFDGAFCVGIPGEARVIFTPYMGGIFWGDDAVLDLEQNYRACYFNPVTGDEIDLGIITPDENRAWRPPNLTAYQDWVIALVKE